MKTRNYGLVLFLLASVGCGPTGFAAPLGVETSSDPSFDTRLFPKLAVIVVDEGSERTAVVVKKKGTQRSTAILFSSQTRIERAVEDEFVSALISKGYTLSTRSDLLSILKEQAIQDLSLTENNSAGIGKVLKVQAVMLVRLTGFHDAQAAGAGGRPATSKASGSLGARLMSVDGAKILWTGRCSQQITATDTSKGVQSAVLAARRVASVFPKRGAEDAGSGISASVPTKSPLGAWKPATSGPRPATSTVPPALAVAPFDAAQARQHQAAWAKHLGVPVETTNSIGMRFMLIPPGEFDMGSTESEIARLLEQAKSTNQASWYIDRLCAEAPKHRVRITRPFWLVRHEVTRGQFRRFVDERGYRTEAERDGKGGFGPVEGQWKQDPRFVWNWDMAVEHADDHPVGNVTWNDVSAFCTWLSEKERETTHLPSEAQWEYACRAGTEAKSYSGENENALKEHAWFNANSSRRTSPVGRKTPNAWGVYDMHGNVYEWCQDWWGDGYYSASPLDDPTGASSGSDRVFRGGSWDYYAGSCRSAFRRRLVPSYRSHNLGFRVARQVSLPPPVR